MSPCRAVWRKWPTAFFAYVQPDGSWMINNTGFVVVRDGVTAIDACATERRTRAFLDTITDVTRLPVRTLVNTHHHPDHTAGNGLSPGRRSASAQCSAVLRPSAPAPITTTSASTRPLCRSPRAGPEPGTWPGRSACGTFFP